MSELRKCLVDMGKPCGAILHGIEAEIDDKGRIWFTRDDEGVHPWHCNRVHKDDYNVVRISYKALPSKGKRTTDPNTP